MERWPLLTRKVMNYGVLVMRDYRNMRRRKDPIMLIEIVQIIELIRDNT